MLAPLAQATAPCISSYMHHCARDHDSNICAHTPPYTYEHTCNCTSILYIYTCVCMYTCGQPVKPVWCALSSVSSRLGAVFLSLSLGVYSVPSPHLFHTLSLTPFHIICVHCTPCMYVRGSFRDGEHRLYNGARTLEAFISYSERVTGYVPSLCTMHMGGRRINCVYVYMCTLKGMRTSPTYVYSTLRVLIHVLVTVAQAPGCGGGCRGVGRIQRPVCSGVSAVD